MLGTSPRHRKRRPSSPHPELRRQALRDATYSKTPARIQHPLMGGRISIYGPSDCFFWGGELCYDRQAHRRCRSRFTVRRASWVRMLSGGAPCSHIRFPLTALCFGARMLAGSHLIHISEWQLERRCNDTLLGPKRIHNHYLSIARRACDTDIP